MAKLRTTRRVVLVKPHLVQRDPAEQAAVWRQRGRAFGSIAVVWLLLAIIGAVASGGSTLVLLALAASVLSAGVVLKARVIVRRATRDR